MFFMYVMITRMWLIRFVRFAYVRKDFADAADLRGRSSLRHKDFADAAKVLGWFWDGPGKLWGWFCDGSHGVGMVLGWFRDGSLARPPPTAYRTHYNFNIPTDKNTTLSF